MPLPGAGPSQETARLEGPGAEPRGYGAPQERGPRPQRPHALRETESRRGATPRQPPPPVEERGTPEWTTQSAPQDRPEEAERAPRPAEEELREVRPPLARPILVRRGPARGEAPEAEPGEQKGHGRVRRLVGGVGGENKRRPERAQVSERERQKARGQEEVVALLRHAEPVARRPLPRGRPGTPRPPGAQAGGGRRGRRQRGRRAEEEGRREVVVVEPFRQHPGRGVVGAAWARKGQGKQKLGFLRPVPRWAKGEELIKLPSK